MDAAHASCEICRDLRPVETSLYKFGWEENDRPLPVVSRRLVPVEWAVAGDENRAPKRCPLCGTVYSYETRYEYLANGSEDEEELRRLTDAEARAWLGDAAVDSLPAPLLAPLRETFVNSRVLVFSTGGDSLAASWGANAVAVLGDGGTLVVDPLVAPAYARELKRLLAGRGASPVRWVVTTHHHTDHSVGASVFAADGAEVIAHAAAAELMEREHPILLARRRASADVEALFADAVPAVPSRRVTEPLAIPVGGTRAVVRPCGPAHTAGDLRIDLPDLGVVVTGDLVSHGYHPNLEDANVPGWRRALGDLLESGATTFVPGHGAPGGREIVEAQAAWFDAAREAVDSALGAGLGEEGARDLLRQRFPGFLLEAVVPAAVDVLRRSGGSGGPGRS